MTGTAAAPSTFAADDLAAQFRALTDRGYRLALVAGHDDDDTIRIVYLLTQPGTDARVELVTRVDHTTPRIPSLSAAVVPRGPLRTRTRRPLRHRPDRPHATPPARAPPTLARRLASPPPRRRPDPDRSTKPANRSRSSPSKAPASTKSPSVPSTPDSSNPATSGSPSSAKPSSR